MQYLLDQILSDSRPVAVIAADLHVDDGSWIPHSNGEDSHWSLYQTFNLAHTLAVDLFLGGDVIDVRRPPSVVIDAIGAVCATCRNLHVRYIQGQHELSTPPWLSLIKEQTTVSHLHTKFCSLPNGQNIVGLDWTPPNLLPEALARIPKGMNILLCHQVWAEFMGSITNPEGSLRDVPHVSQIFTGDYHKHERKTITASDGRKVEVYSPGATNIRKINEPSKHYVYVLHDNGTVSSVRLPTRKVLRLKFETEAQVEDLIRNLARYKKTLINPDAGYTLPVALKTPLLRITIPETLLRNKERITELLADDYHLFWKCTAVVSAEDRKKISAGRALRKSGPAGCLSHVLSRTSSHYAPVLRLLQSKDVRRELASMRSEYGVQE